VSKLFFLQYGYVEKLTVDDVYDVKDVDDNYDDKGDVMYG
jgi:hypothetical protein